MDSRDRLERRSPEVAALYEDDSLGKAGCQAPSGLHVCPSVDRARGWGAMAEP